MKAAAVFVHGLFSSERTWAPLMTLVGDDPDLADIDCLTYPYPSPKFNWRIYQSIPNFNVLADGLGTFLDNEASDYDTISLVTHSQGGLIAQRHLIRMLRSGRGYELERIRQLVLFACPNNGSEFVLSLRQRFASRNVQIHELAPFGRELVDIRDDVINRVVHANGFSESQWPISVFAYAGNQDNIVKPESAHGGFPKPNTGVLPGGHSTIIQANSPTHPAYIALRKHLARLLGAGASRTIPYPREPPQGESIVKRPLDAITHLGAPSPVTRSNSSPPALHRLVGEPPSDEFLVYIVVAAGSTDQMQTVDPKRATTFHRHSFEQWTPYGPSDDAPVPLPNGSIPIAIFAGAVAAVRHLTWVVADIGQLDGLTAAAQVNNQIVVLLLDIWSTLLPGYAETIKKYDQEAVTSAPQRNDPIVVPWSKSDPAYSTERGYFWHTVVDVLPNAVERGDRELLVLGPEDPEDFKTRFASALTAAKIRLYKTGTPFNPAPGPIPQAIPNLSNP